MKYLKFDVGGRPRANDDLDTFQDEVYAALQATLQGAPPMVLSGCQVTRNGNTGEIGAGFVWLANNIQRYDGASNVTFPAEIAAGAYVDSDFRAYQTGESKACMTERELLTQAAGTATAGTAIRFTNNGPGLTYWKWLEGKTRTLGEVQWLTNHNADLYDSTGKGWPDQMGAGWGLCNGEDGRADLRGMFVAGYDPTRNDYATLGNPNIGKEKVALTAAQNGPHNHMHSSGQFGYNQLLRKAPLGSNTTAQSTDGNGNGGNEPDLTTSQPLQSSGLGEEHENRPPYYVLVARQWIGM